MKIIAAILGILLCVTLGMFTYIYQLYTFDRNFVISDRGCIEVEYVEPEWCDEARDILQRSNPRLSDFMADLFVDYIESGVRDFAHIAKVDPIVVARVIAFESNARFDARNTYPGHIVRGPMQVSDVHTDNLVSAGIIVTETDLYGPHGVTAGIYILASYRKSHGDDYLRKYSGGAKYSEGM